MSTQNHHSESEKHNQNQGKNSPLHGFVVQLDEMFVHLRGVIGREAVARVPCLPSKEASV